MKIRTVSEIINPATVKISSENILRSLGVPDGKADHFLNDLISGLIAHCRNICVPRVSYSVFPLPEFSEPGKMKLEDVIFNLNIMVTAALKESEEIALFIGTCGEEVENYSKRLIKEGNSLEGLIADLIGSEIAEGMANYIHNKLASDMTLKGWNTTNRYSPGYCNWPVNDQRLLFRLMENNNPGVVLTNSSLMIPIKSVSGIIGLGRNVRNNEYACKRCDTDHCLYRDRNIHN